MSKINESLRCKGVFCKVVLDDIWSEWSDKIPYIKFPAHWEISIIPPFCLADARFRVKVAPGREDVSVYLDLYDMCGYVGEPYWEIFPGSKEDLEPKRFKLNDIEGLLKGIEGITS